MVDIKTLEAILEKGQDNALLRFALGDAFLKSKQYTEAVEHLVIALEQDPKYSAAWKSYGKSLSALNRTTEAIHAYEQGIQVAENKGDIQAAKEMRVFLKRLK